MYASKNSQGFRTGSPIRRKDLPGRKNPGSIQGRRKSDISGFGYKGLRGERKQACKPGKQQYRARNYKRTCFTAPANNLVLPQFSPDIPGEIIIPQKGNTCIRLLEIAEQAFGEIKYRLSESIEAAVIANWNKNISGIYKHSKGWRDGGNKDGVDFGIILATPEVIHHELGDNCCIEDLPGSLYLLHCANGCSFYYIENGIRHLEAGHKGLGELALLLLQNTPMEIYTPFRMEWDIQAFEWMGRGDEQMRYEELPNPDDPEEREAMGITTKNDLTRNFPEWVLNPKSKLYEDEKLWNSPCVPEPMKKLKAAIGKYYECRVDESCMDYSILPCPVVVWGKPDGEADNIMTRALDTMADMKQQSGHCYISPFVMSLDAGEPAELMKQFGAYLDCVYWTGELLTYLQGKID
jgi:hypothetical protein